MNMFCLVEPFADVHEEEFERLATSDVTLCSSCVESNRHQAGWGKCDAVVLQIPCSYIVFWRMDCNFREYLWHVIYIAFLISGVFSFWSCGNDLKVHSDSRISPLPM